MTLTPHIRVIDRGIITMGHQAQSTPPARPDRASMGDAASFVNGRSSDGPIEN